MFSLVNAESSKVLGGDYKKGAFASENTVTHLVIQIKTGFAKTIAKTKASNGFQVPTSYESDIYMSRSKLKHAEWNIP